MNISLPAGLNTQIIMTRYPDGPVSSSNFEAVRQPIEEPRDGEILVRNEWLSLDPYMRLRMDPRRSYVEPVKPGDVMPGGTVGTVVASKHPRFPVGSIVVGAKMRWEVYTCTDPSSLRLVQHHDIPASTALGVVGMPGITAHYGLLKLGKPKRGDTVVVSAATGAVGSVVGQLAKAQGCHVVGIAGGPEKCRYAMDHLGFDHCVDYKAADFVEQLTAATMNRVDIHFENVGGKVMDAVFTRLNSYARIVVCGLISDYDKQHSYGLKNIRELLVNRVSLQAFIISEHMEYWPEATQDLANRVKNGTLIYREDVTDGLLAAPKAFIDMLYGRNFGKTIVRITEHELN